MRWHLISGTKTKCLRSRVSKTPLAVSAGRCGHTVYSFFVNVASHEFLPLFLRRYLFLCYAMLFYAKFPSHEASVLPRLPAAPCSALPPRKRVNPNPHTRLFLSILGSTIRTPSLAITKCIVKKSRKYIYLSNRPVHADPRMPCSLQMRSSLMPCSRLRSSQFMPS
jgi:hypothetical protein